VKLKIKYSQILSENKNTLKSSLMDILKYFMTK
jgi:hypothetical protein